IRTDCIFIGFEADEAETNRLRAHARPNERYLTGALDRERGRALLHHCVVPTRSSLYEPDLDAVADLFGTSAPFEVDRVESIDVSTIDAVWASGNLPPPDFLKLDTQGSELDILRGGRNVLDTSVIGIETEVEFLPLYKNQPLFPEVFEFLRSQGFD